MFVDANNLFFENEAKVWNGVNVSEQLSNPVIFELHSD
jgi:hypothetical protein